MPTINELSLLAGRSQGAAQKQQEDRQRSFQEQQAAKQRAFQQAMQREQLEAQARRLEQQRQNALEQFALETEWEEQMAHLERSWEQENAQNAFQRELQLNAMDNQFDMAQTELQNQAAMERTLQNIISQEERDIFREQQLEERQERGLEAGLEERDLMETGRTERERLEQQGATARGFQDLLGEGVSGLFDYLTGGEEEPGITAGQSRMSSTIDKKYRNYLKTAQVPNSEGFARRLVTESNISPEKAEQIAGNLSFDMDTVKRIRGNDTSEKERLFNDLGL